MPIPRPSPRPDDVTPELRAQTYAAVTRLANAGGALPVIDLAAQCGFDSVRVALVLRELERCHVVELTGDPGQERACIVPS